MPITLKKGILKYKNTSTGQYEGVDVVAETATSDQVEAIEDAASAEISAIEAKGVETRESIPDDYTALSDEVADLRSIIPEPPTANGVYVLTVTVANGVATYSWTAK